MSQVTKRLLRAFCIALFTLPVVFAATGRYYITRLPARVVPEKAVVLEAPEQAEAVIVHRGETAEKGDILARLHPKEADIARREYELELRRSEVAAQEDILSLSRQREELSFFISLPEDQRLYVQKKLKAGGDQRAVALLDEKIQLRKEALDVEQDKLRALYEQKVARSELRMPFRGRIQYHIPLPDTPEEPVLLAPNVPVVTVADDSALYAVVPLTESELVNLKAEHLSLQLDENTACPLTAVYHHRAVEKTDTGQSLLYYFLLPAEAKAHCWSLLGAHLVAELYYEGESVTYVRKDDLAAAAGNQVFETWQDLVRVIYPGYRVLFCGETHLALEPEESE